MGNSSSITYRTHSFSESLSAQTSVSALSEADIPMLDQIRRYLEDKCIEDNDDWGNGSIDVDALFAGWLEDEYDTEAIYHDLEEAIESNIYRTYDANIYAYLLEFDFVLLPKTKKKKKSKQQIQRDIKKKRK